MEHLIDFNTRAILKELPGGEKYRLTGSGKIVQKQETDFGRDSLADSAYSGASRSSLNRGRGRGRGSHRGTGPEDIIHTFHCEETRKESA